ncbi:Panacea domain-containing protein [Peptoniphilus rhinitidis]|uniref:Panacea domain-containing protein n=1 Tax=Peptoniphilus rhinitidis TaxID=1175452 RepID=UPI0028FE257F|nr:Panacea domain-containing protein [Peptoniphilus rhinitidis]MDU1029649.1 Panacea domain-containing protein [Clostridiales bacterium]MDU1044546.1 Panacea domain-containing protein [Peptoniphilus rhinitidis]MDU3750875.1 Panacea domain-containing protein [Peptoniphilus rhinitidis]
MKTKLRNVLLYIVKNYPYGDDLTKTRITKLVYLIDWEYTKKYGKQMTEISWYFDHYGPYVSDVLDEADEDKTVSIQSTLSNFGTIKYIVRPKYDKELIHYEDLDVSEIEVINEVFENTKMLSWNQFINYVYDTPPIKESRKYSNLDLTKFI